LAKLAGEGKIDELFEAMVKMGAVYYGPYLKENAENPSATNCMWWICTGSNTTYQRIHAAAITTATAATRPVTEADFVFPVPLLRYEPILKDISKGNTYKNSPVGITETDVNRLSTSINNDLGKIAFLAYMEWPSMANDATKYETDETLIDIDEIFKVLDVTETTKSDVKNRVLGWFAAPNNLNDKVLTNALAPQSFPSEYVQAAINALPYDEFFKVGKYDAMKNLLNEHRQKYMTTPSTPTGTYLPVPVFVNLNQPGGGKEDPFFFFSSNATDIMKGVKLYLAGKKKQAFSPESEKQIMSAISNVAKHEKEYFAKIQEVNSQRYGSKYSMEEKQAMVDTIGKTLTLKINRLKDLINSVVTQAIA
jgi:hypothetical protein